MSWTDTTDFRDQWDSFGTSSPTITLGPMTTASSHRWCLHASTALARVGKRHAEVRCLKCQAVLVRVRVEPPPSAPLVLRAAPPAADVPRAPVVLRAAVERRHRASPRRFARAS